MISSHRKSDAQDDLEGVLLVSMDFRFLGEKEPEEQVTQMTGAMLVPKKGNRTSLEGEKRAAKFSDQLGNNRVVLRCDSELEVEALARELTHRLVKRDARPFRRDREWEKASPTGSSRALSLWCWPFSEH